MSDDGIVIFIGLVLAIHGVLAGLLANSKGYNPVGAFLAAFVTGGLPVLIFYAGLPVTSEKQFSTRRALLTLASAHNQKFPEGSAGFVDPSHL